MLANLCIEPIDKITNRYRVLIENQDVSHCVRSITITMGVEYPAPQVNIEWVLRPDFPKGLMALVSSTLYDPMELKGEILKTETT